MARSTGHGIRLSHYDFGATTVYAARDDRRFSYCCYVPEAYEEEGTSRHPLVVVVHGTERGMTTYRDHFADLAEETGAIVLAPLFPAGMTVPGELSSYKMIREGGICYDTVLLGMVAEIEERYRIAGGGFCLYGFSGGGHFAHRFFYLHPERLRAVSIGAPGVVSLLDPERPWWVGVGGFEQVFGKALDLEAMRRVPVHMVIGGDDTQTWEITLEPGHGWWMEDANVAGANRQDRMAALKASFEAHGIAVEQDVVAGAAHSGGAVIGPVKDFFRRVLSDGQTETRQRKTPT